MKRWKLSSVFVLMFSAGAFFYMTYFSYPFTVDDAYISFRYSEHLANGYGLRWNIDGPPTEGYTNFFWVLLLAVPSYFGLDVALFAKIIGISSVIFIFLLQWKIYKNLFENKRGLLISLSVGGILILVNPLTAVHAVSGLETMFYSMTLVGILYSGIQLINENNNHNHIYPFVCLVAGLTRPEAVLVAGIFTSFIYLYLYLKPENSFKNILRTYFIAFSIIYILPSVAYMSWRILYFDRIFPLSFYAKSGASLLPGIANSISAGAYVAPYFAIGIFAAISSSSRISDLHQPYLSKLGFILTGIVIISISSVIIYPFSDLFMNYAMRYFFPSFVLLLIGTGLFVGLGIEEDISSDPGGYFRLTLVAIFVLLLIISQAQVYGELSEARSSGQSLQNAHAELGKALHQHEDENLTFASIDAGAIPYYSGWRHIDMWSLNTPNIIFSSNQTSVYSYIQKEDPELIIFISENGENIKNQPNQRPFERYADNNNYTKLCPIRFGDEYYLLPYLGRDIRNYSDVRSTIQNVCD